LKILIPVRFLVESLTQESFRENIIAQAVSVLHAGR
jgi:hypothetical protein